MAFSSVQAFGSALSSHPWQLGMLVVVALALLTIAPPTFFPPSIIPAGNALIRTVDIPIPKPVPYPVNINRAPAPLLSAQSGIAIDASSKAVLFSKYPNAKLSPASTTKMVTALVALDLYNPDQVASLSSVLREGQVMGLVPGENISIRNLLAGAMIHSANDAAEALATLSPQGKSGFVEKMNQKVQILGLTDTHFVNPTGFDHYDHFSTVHDLAHIGLAVMQDPLLASYANTKTLTVGDVTGKIMHPLKNVNDLLGIVPGMKGIKTGYTEAAGECLVGYIERDGQTIVTVLLGSQDRFLETSMLVDWIFKNHRWEEIRYNDQ